MLTVNQHDQHKAGTQRDCLSEGDVSIFCKHTNKRYLSGLPQGGSDKLIFQPHLFKRLTLQIL